MKIERVQGQGNLYSFRCPKLSLADRLTAGHLFGMALEAEQIGDKLKAVSLYLKVLEINPQAAGALINLGDTHFNQGEFKLAEQHFRKAIELEPEDAMAHFNLGNTLSSLSQIEESIACYLKAVELCPTYADAHFNLGIEYFKIEGKEALAIRYFRLHLKCGDSPIWTRQSKQYIKTLQERLLSRMAPWQRPSLVP